MFCVASVYRIKSYKRSVDQLVCGRVGETYLTFLPKQKREGAFRPLSRYDCKVVEINLLGHFGFCFLVLDTPGIHEINRRHS